MPYIVSLKQFDGPLDLLLTLISNAKLDIQDIFVSEITEQYLESMKLVDELDMDSASEFLQMAATLLEIKSRAMLPKPPKPEAEDELSPEEALIKQLFTRKYMWATHVWNMFDFGADARSEGGENGQNHKGLMTFDRKYKKDSFFAYKAWLNPEPMVHLCGKRYVDRVEDVTKVTVYSNQPTVELFANGVSMGKKTAEDHFFRFEVPNAGETKLVAVAGDCRDESVIRKVDTFNEEYRLVEKGTILNWFDVTEKEGRLSLNSKMGEVLKTFRGKLIFLSLMKKVMGGKKKGEKKKGGMKAMGFEINADMMSMMNGFTVLRLFTLMGGMADIKFTNEELLELNAKLNKIKAPKK